MRQHNIKILPNYSILTFNRFAYNTTLKKKVKLDFKVPLEEYIHLPYQTEFRENQNVLYELYSIIVHRVNRLLFRAHHLNQDIIIHSLNKHLNKIVNGYV